MITSVQERSGTRGEIGQWIQRYRQEGSVLVTAVNKDILCISK
jgi:hypothetical protein